MSIEMKKNSDTIQISMNPIVWVIGLYNGIVTILAVLFDNTSFLLGKLFKPFLYLLEMIGIYYILYMISKYETGLNMIENGAIEQGTAYINALISVAETLNGIILAMAAALPAFLGAMRIAKQKFIDKDISKVDKDDEV